MELGRFKPFLIGAGILAAAIALAVAMITLKPKAEQEETTKPPLSVRTATAIETDQVVFSTFQGEVRAKTEIELVTQVTGKVVSVSDKFIEGGEFQPGETLLSIDDADYQVALKSAEANVASAQVDYDIELATAATNAKEWNDLQGKPLSEANPLRLNKPQIDRAKARLNAAKAELAAAQLNYQRTKISAPFAGRIMTKSAELGQFMSRGSSIGRVFATDTMEIRIPMTDVQVAELGLTLGYSARKQADAGLPAVVSTQFGDEKVSWPGNVRSVDANVDSETRLLYATVVVDNPFSEIANTNLPLVPGLFVDVEVASPKTLSGLELPREALRNGAFVYVYQEEELKQRPVKVVYTSADKVVIDNSGKSQLTAGERVIVSSVPGAYEGMPVKLPADEAINAATSDESTTPADDDQSGDSQQQAADEQQG